MASLSINRIFLDKYFESSIDQAIRVALSFAIPLVYGFFSGDLEATLWIAISAQVTSNVNVEGSYPLKILIMGLMVLLCGLTSMLGTLAGNNWIISAVLMFVLAFLGGFVRESGPHGISIYIGALLLYLLSLEHPGNLQLSLQVLAWTIAGGIIAVSMAVISWGAIPFNPFRRSIANTWKAMSDWLYSIPYILEKNGEKEEEEMEDKELKFREELSQSSHVLSREQALIHSRKNRISYLLVELRRIVSFINPAVSSILVLLENSKEEVPRKLMSYILENIAQATRRIAIGIISRKPSHIYASAISLRKIRNNTRLLRKKMENDTSGFPKDQLFASLDEITENLEEAIKILENIGRKSGMNFFMKNFYTGLTVPQRIKMVRFEFDTHSFVFRFSLRLALAMGLSIAVYKLSHIPNGYWIAMTVMIILQPDFGSTFTKASRRLKGTVSGALAGSLLFLLPIPRELTLIIVIFCAFTMSYYLKSNYAVAAFFITIMVIALYHLIEPVTWELGGIRVMNTILGAGVALLGGYAFFPIWERTRFRDLLAASVSANKDYFLTLMDAGNKHLRTKMDFIKPRRKAEVANSNAFRSLRRMKEEPNTEQEKYPQFYLILGYAIRLTRVLKSYNLVVTTSPFPHFVMIPKETFQNKIAGILQDTLDIIENKIPVNPEKITPEDLLDQMSYLFQKVENEENAPENSNVRYLFNRIIKETFGLYYAVSELNDEEQKGTSA